MNYTLNLLYGLLARTHAKHCLLSVETQVQLLLLGVPKNTRTGRGIFKLADYRY
ncbi:Uncharacterized protein DAT39_001925, partial [Clarias magur]